MRLFEMTKIQEPKQREITSYKKQGEIIEVKMRLNYCHPIPCKPRGNIKVFSRASRLRMLKWFARIDWAKNNRMKFITVTYPDAKIERTTEERAKDRYLFQRYVEKYAQKQVPMVWRNEWTARQTGEHKGEEYPHVHFLAFNCPFVPWQQIRKWWSGILHHSGKLFTDVRQIKNPKQAGYYVAKYIAKVPETTSLDNHAYHNNPGRHWGITRKRLIALSPVERLGELTQEEIGVIMAIAKQFIPDYNTEIGGSFTLLGKNCLEFFRIMEEKGLDGGQGH